MTMNSQRRHPKYRNLRALFGGSIIFSVLTLLSLSTRLPSHESLRRSTEGMPTAQITDLFALVQTRQNAHATSTPETLHVDDLVHSYSYQRWAPVIVTKCVHGMDPRAAPCLKEANETNMVDAQELMYPAFRLKLPNFISTEIQAKWLSQGLHIKRMRVSEDLVWAEYPTFLGQNMVFSNAVFRGDPPPDAWSEKGCMGRAASHTSFVHDLNDYSNLANESNIDTLIVATSPDSWSFQHFIDRVAPVWSQAQLVVPTVKKSDTVIVSGRPPRNPLVNDIYELMVGRHLHKWKVVAAKKLVFSCRAPLIHPFTTQRVSENILHSLPPSTDTTESDRNIILFLSRSKGGKALNGGRRILNEGELFNATAAMLKEQGRPEELQYFRHDKFNGLEEVASFMRDRVKMMIGPHGAAFYNARFAQPRTALIEIIPDPEKFFVPCFWEQARLLGQDYSAHVAETQGKKNDMMIRDAQDIVRLVRNRLEYIDKAYRMEDALDHTYAWDVKANGV